MLRRALVGLGIVGWGGCGLAAMVGWIGWPIGAFIGMTFLLPYLTYLAMWPRQ